MFLIEAFTDANGNLVMIIYGFGWKGTFAGGLYFKNRVYPSIGTFTDAWYIYRWADQNGNGFVELNEITLVNHGT